MKKLNLLAGAAVMLFTSGAAHAAIPYTPPEFVASDWTDCGIGSYEPGIFDYFGNEYPGTIPCQMYKNVNNQNEIWVEPIISAEIREELEATGEGLQPAGPFILHIDNSEKVWVSPIWSLHPLVFCFYQLVPEVMGVQGSDKYYGTLNDLKVTFPKGSFIVGTLPTGTPTSNNGGNFAINMPNPTGIEAIADESNSEPIYYNISGIKVDRPQSGLYIVKTGNKVKKVLF